MTTTSLRPAGAPGQQNSTPVRAASTGASPTTGADGATTPATGAPAAGRSRRNPLAAFTGFPRPIWVIFAGTVVNRIGFLVGPFLVFFLGSRGVSASQTPYVLGALGAGNLVGPAVGGWLADRRGRKATILAGLAGTAATQGLLFEAPNVLTMALAAALLTSTATMVGPAAYATLTDTVEAGRRREAFALFGWAVNIGTAAAGVLGGYLAAHGYWMLFALDAGTSVAYALIVLALLPNDRAPRAAAGGSGAASEATGGAATSSGYGVVLRDRLMVRLLPLFGIQLFIYSLTESALPLAIRTDGLSPAVMGMAAAVNAGIVVALQPTATSFLARFDRTPVYTVSALLIAGGVALTGLAHTPLQYAATVAVWSIGEVAAGGVAAGMIADLAPADARGRYQGAFSWTWGVSRFLALGAGTTVYSLVGPAYLWWAVLAAGLAATVGVAALSPAVDARTAAAADSAVG